MICLQWGLNQFSCHGNLSIGHLVMVEAGAHLARRLPMNGIHCRKYVVRAQVDYVIVWR